MQREGPDLRDWEARLALIVVIPGRALARLLRWWMKQPAERGAGIGILNVNQNKYELKALQTQVFEIIRDIRGLDVARRAQINPSKRHFKKHLTAAAEPRDLDDDGAIEYVYATDVAGFEGEDESVPEEIVAEETDADNEVIKLEQVLGNAKGCQKGARAPRGFYHKADPRGPERGGRRTRRRRQGVRQGPDSPA